MPKTPGQIAYERELLDWPNYHDGAPRKIWAQLDSLSRWSWERNPTPRRPRVIEGEAQALT